MRALALVLFVVAATTVGAAPRREPVALMKLGPPPTAFVWRARVASEARARGARPRLGATELAAIAGRRGATEITAISLHRAKRPIGLWWLIRGRGRFVVDGPPGATPFVSPTAYLRIIDRSGEIWGFGVP